ncbi:hypothetical protein C8R47DRAFT_1083775 [Mycena vitilis]|nr:hypothetical protein C8R47DRAFT_1083775 [Mycena vitilis]
MSPPTRISTRSSLGRRRGRRSSSVPNGQALREMSLLGVSSVRFYAIWGEGVVYSSKYGAQLAFEAAMDVGDEVELLSTSDFDIALAYAEGRDSVNASDSGYIKEWLSGKVALSVLPDTRDDLFNLRLDPFPASSPPPPNNAPPNNVLPEVAASRGADATHGASGNSLPQAGGGEGEVPLPSGAPGAPPASLASLPPGSILCEETGQVYMPPERPPIVERESGRRGKRADDSQEVKRGKPGWIWGTKFVFFDKRKEQWREAVEQKTPGDFYTKMAKSSSVKYGFDLEDKEDFAYDVADPPDWVANVVVNVQLPPDEVARRQAYVQKLRERLGQWYRGQYQSLLEKDKTSFGELFAGLGHTLQKAPRLPQVVHFYSNRHYETRVKDRVAERKLAVATQAKYTGEEPPAPIAVQNKVTKECWDDESREFQEELIRARNREHDIVLKGWRESLADSPSRTPEDFNASLQTAAHYLQPFVDAIAERYGMCASLLLCGPIGARGGRIGMRSVHAGTTRGLVEMDWPSKDPAGFSKVEACMVEFGHHVFSQNECDARSLDVQVDGGRGADGAGDDGGMVSNGPRRAGQGQGGSGGELSPGAHAGAHAGGVSDSHSSSGGLSLDPHALRVNGAGDESTGGAGAGGRGAAEDTADDTAGASAGGAGGAADDTAGASAGGAGGAADDTAGASAGGAGGAADEADGASGDGAGGGGGLTLGSGGGDEEDAAVIDRLWRRRDRRQWSAELVSAHSAFERVRVLGGKEWAALVDAFYDFEKQFGYSEDGSQITATGRPLAVKRWIGRLRNWDRKVDVGELGMEGTADTFADEWWKWWSSVQPKERANSGGALSRPSKADWSCLVKLHGRNGLLQVMATLLWWAEALPESDGATTDGGPSMDYMGWFIAVADVYWVMRQLLEPGVIGKQQGGRKRKANDAPAEEVNEGRRGRSGGDGNTRRSSKRAKR